MFRDVTAPFGGYIRAFLGVTLARLKEALCEGYAEL